MKDREDSDRVCALKIVTEWSYFEAELRGRGGMDGNYIVQVLRAHVPAEDKDRSRMYECNLHLRLKS